MVQIISSEQDRYIKRTPDGTLMEVALTRGLSHPNIVRALRHASFNSQVRDCFLFAQMPAVVSCTNTARALIQIQMNAQNSVTKVLLQSVLSSSMLSKNIHIHVSYCIWH